MNRLPIPTALCLGLALAFAGISGASAWVMPETGTLLAADLAPRRLAEGGDCSSAAAEAAAQTGGQVLSVSTRQQGGQTVCVVTVLVPGKDGDRPRRQTITIRP